MELRNDIRQENNKKFKKNIKHILAYIDCAGQQNVCGVSQTVRLDTPAGNKTSPKLSFLVLKSPQ